MFLAAYLEDTALTSQPGSATLLPLIGTLSSGIIYCSGICHGFTELGIYSNFTPRTSDISRDIAISSLEEKDDVYWYDHVLFEPTGC